MGAINNRYNYKNAELSASCARSSNNSNERRRRRRRRRRTRRRRRLRRRRRKKKKKKKKKKKEEEEEEGEEEEELIVAIVCASHSNASARTGSYVEALHNPKSSLTFNVTVQSGMCRNLNDPEGV